MILSIRDNKVNVNLTLNGDEISRVNSDKFIGVMNDKTFKIDVLINKVCTKVSQS